MTLHHHTNFKTYLFFCSPSSGLYPLVFKNYHSRPFFFSSSQTHSLIQFTSISTSTNFVLPVQPIHSYQTHPSPRRSSKSIHTRHEHLHIRNSSGYKGSFLTRTSWRSKCLCPPPIVRHLASPCPKARSTQTALGGFCWRRYLKMHNAGHHSPRPPPKSCFPAGGSKQGQL